MRLFLDTEFTDLTLDAELISIGLITEDGDKRFYIELSDWDRQKANDFVRTVVVPLLGQPCVSTKSSSECAAALMQWLGQFDADLEVVSDSAWDWRLLKRLLGDGLIHTSDTTARFATDNRELRFRLYSIRSAVEERIHLTAAREWLQGQAHHALNDALALRAGVLAVEHSYARAFD